MWNKKFLILNGISMLAVVMNHAAHRGFTSMFWWAHRYRPVVSPNFDQLGSLPYYALSVILQLTIFSVPAFIFVTGFFIAYAARGSQTTIKWGIVKVRVINLLIPYIIWSLLIFLLEFFLGFVDSPLGYIRRILLRGAVDAYFFVPLLIQFYLLSPLIVKLARDRWKSLLIFSAMLQLGANLLWYLDYYNLNELGIMLPPWTFPTMIFFFSTGVIVGLYMKETKKILERSKWVLLTVAVVAAVFSLVEYQAYAVTEDGTWAGDFRSILNNIYAIAFIGSFLAFELNWIPFSKGLIQIGKRSYGIYLIHVPVLMMVAKILYHVAPMIVGFQLIFQSILIIAGIGVPLLMMEIVVRSPARRYFKYLFG